VGYILGGTPRSIQIVELIAVLVASSVMYFPLLLLHQGDISAGGTGLGSRGLPAPQAGLMALLAQGIVGGDMPWSLVLVGILMGISLIMLSVKSPMLVAVGMYLPLETTAAIFVGGMIRSFADKIAIRRGYNEAQRTRVENAGVLTASGLIAGEALMGLVWAALQFDFARKLRDALVISAHPFYSFGLIVMLGLAVVMIFFPMRGAGNPADPAPPVAMM
jgi:putative OPT family oligopeptide transporter